MSSAGEGDGERNFRTSLILSIAVPIGVDGSNDEKRPSEYVPSSAGPIVPVTAIMPPPTFTTWPRSSRFRDVTLPVDSEPETTVTPLPPPPPPPVSYTQLTLPTILLV